MALERDDAPSADGPLVRALAAPLRALLGAADAVLVATLRALSKKRGGEASAGSAPPALKAIPGGATTRSRRRADAAPADRVPAEDEDLAEVGLDIGDADAAVDFLLVLARDPQTVFVTWQRSAAAEALRARRIAASGSGVRDALSVEVEDALLESDGEQGASSWTVTLPPLAESIWVDLERPRGVVHVTLGTQTEGGAFLASTTPATVRLPESAPAPYQAPRWRSVVGASPDGHSPPPEPSHETADLLHDHALRERGHGRGDEGPAVDAVTNPTAAR